MTSSNYSNVWTSFATNNTSQVAYSARGLARNESHQHVSGDGNNILYQLADGFSAYNFGNMWIGRDGHNRSTQIAVARAGDGTNILEPDPRHGSNISEQVVSATGNGYNSARHVLTASGTNSLNQTIFAGASATNIGNQSNVSGVNNNSQFAQATHITQLSTQRLTSGSNTIVQEGRGTGNTYNSASQSNAYGSNSTSQLGTGTVVSNVSGQSIISGAQSLLQVGNGTAAASNYGVLSASGRVETNAIQSATSASGSSTNTLVASQSTGNITSDQESFANRQTGTATNSATLYTSAGNVSAEQIGSGARVNNAISVVPANANVRTEQIGNGRLSVGQSVYAVTTGGSSSVRQEGVSTEGTTSQSAVQVGLGTAQMSASQLASAASTAANSLSQSGGVRINNEQIALSQGASASNTLSASGAREISSTQVAATQAARGNATNVATLSTSGNITIAQVAEEGV